MKKKVFLQVLLIFTLITMLIGSALAAPDKDIAGRWEGKIEIPGTPLEIVIDFTRQPDGALKGSISIPAQKAKDLPLASIEQKDAEVSFAIAGVPGNPVFKGKLNPEADQISGTFTQGGASFSFSLARGANRLAKAREALKDFDGVVNQALEKLKVPGVAIAVVKDKDIAFSGGFGLRNVERKLPMTPDTILAIGSSTKAFTTFVLGMLVDEGKVEWDKPVRNYIPWIRFYDEQAGLRITPRDLVTHRSGLPRHDLAWYNNLTGSREELVRRLPFLPATADLRAKFQYNNLMYVTAGYLIETLTGKSWEENVRDKIFEPLGMKKSNFSVRDSEKESDFALPYDRRQDKVQKIPFREITVVGPAGSINSSVNDMSRWLIVNLNNGLFNDKKIISPNVLQDLHTPYMTLSSPSTTPDITPPDYALGWMVDSYRGKRRIHHGGNIDGFSAMVCLLPDEGLGFVALANMNATALPELIIRTAIDRILGLEPRPWIDDAIKRMAEGEEIGKEAQKKMVVRRKAGTRPAHKLDEYCGLYNHPGYGDLKVELKGPQLIFTFNNITTPLEHWHYETFNGLESSDPVFKDFKITFVTDVNGNVAGLKAAFEPTTAELVFEKKPDQKLFDANFLSKFTGEYQMKSQVARVALKGNVLTLAVQGQPVYDLIPDASGEFKLKQVPVISIRFIEDVKGKVVALEANQPGGVFEFKRVKD